LYAVVVKTVAPAPSTFPVEDAWKPLPESLWKKDTASHFLRRFGFAATPSTVEEALWSTPAKLTRQALSRRNEFAPSNELNKYERTAPERYRTIRREDFTEDQRRGLRTELRQENNELFRQFCRQWFVWARDPDHSPREKLLLFFQNIFVVQRSKVRETPLLFHFQQTLREGIPGNYPDLCKAVSREPAMIQYLDLHLNQKDNPNENFVREFFELFTLGEGNYTELDVKEATRAFTHYRIRNRYEFRLQNNARDQGQKTVFGQKGNWDGDDIVDLTFQQPAAREFLIKELIRYYLTTSRIPDEYVQELGRMWAQRNYDLLYLLETFFQGQLFYHPAYRGNLVKSPVQFYLGLCQDMRLDVMPFPSRLMRSMDAMGQSFYNPPNVRGWLYGENWINSTTINARRHLVSYLFGSMNRSRLNANELMELEEAESQGLGHFLVKNDRLEAILDLSSEQLAEHFTTYFVSEVFQQSYQSSLVEILDEPERRSRPQKIKTAVMALLQSPAYNLC